jgi:hypothetical protein
MKIPIISLIFIFIIFLSIIYFNLDTHIESTKCYDRFYNEIKGLQCEKEVYNNMTLFGILGILLIISIIYAFYEAFEQHEIVIQ